MQIQSQKSGFFLGLLATSSLLSSIASAAPYTIDADHSTVGFKVRHLAISSVPGNFAKFSGNFDFDPANLAKSSAEVTIDAQSISTNNQKRDDHLRNPDFLDTAKFSNMTFKSKSITAKSATTFEALGDLTIRGVTKPVTLNVEFQGSATDPWGNERAAFSATTKFNRKDFGLTWNKALETGGLVVGDEVAVNIEVEGIKKKA